MSRSPDQTRSVPFPVPTPVGDARVWLDEPAGDTHALVVLGHGAGGGVGTADLQALAAALPNHGLAVALVDQPWVVEGRRVAVPPPRLDRAFQAVVPAVRVRVGTDVPLVVGGRSAGARVACRTAVSVKAEGILALAFPLHPPGRPEKSRIDELVGGRLPTLVIQGERDPFGSPADLSTAVAVNSAASTAARIEIELIPAADHSLRVPARAPVTAEETLQRIVDVVQGWVGKLVA